MPRTGWPRQACGIPLSAVGALLLASIALGGHAAAQDREPVGAALIEAVKTHRHEVVRDLIARTVDVNAAQADGTTALHWAAHTGNLEAVRLLVRAGAAVEARNRYAMTPLALACGRGHAEIVAALLAAGADPDTSLPEGETVLMTAARTGNVNILRQLVAGGADVGHHEHWRGQTALMWAAAENHAQAVRPLVQLGAEVDDRSFGGWSALLFAVRAGHREAVRALLAAGADVNDAIGVPGGGEKPGRTAAPRGHGAGTSALIIAITNAHYSLAAFLLEQGADPNAAEQGWGALHQLAYTRRPNSGKGLPPVERVDSLDSLALARTLLAHGADPNQRQTARFDNGERNNLNRTGATPYLLAAKHADLPFMQLLADHGADTGLATEGNASPLMVAAGVGIFNVGESAGTNEEAFEAVRLAYELGDHAVTQADDRGYTALHGAALRGANPIVQFLVERGADLLAETQEGWTPLRIADGVHYTGTVKRADQTAVLLRQFMREHGVYTVEHERDVNSVAVVKPVAQ